MSGVIHYRPEHQTVACGAQVREPERLTADPEKSTCGACARTEAHNGALNAQVNRRRHEEFYKPGGTAEQYGMADWQIREKALGDAKAMAVRAIAERDEARAVVREMCSVLAEYGEGGQDNDQIVQWRQRAGIGGES